MKHGENTRVHNEENSSALLGLIARNGEEMMKVTFILPHSLEAVGDIFSNPKEYIKHSGGPAQLCKAVSNEGHPVLFYFLSTKLHKVTTYRHSLGHIIMGCPTTVSKGYNRELSFSLLKRIFRENTDIFHIRGLTFPLCEILSFISMIRRKPFIIHVLGSAGVRKTKFLSLLNPRTYILTFVFDKASWILCINRKGMRKIQEVVKDKNKVIFFPNGVDLELFHPRDKSLAREKLGLSKDRKIILFIGRIVWLKGLHHLIEAMGYIKRNLTNLLLIVIGTGSNSYEKESKIKAKEYGLEDMIKFLGFVPSKTLKWYYNSADVFVLPSFAEGFPQVCLEAAASGLPIITTTVLKGSGTFKDGENCIMVPPADSLALAKAIENVLNDAELRNKFTEEGIKNVIKNHSWEKLAKQLTKIYLTGAKASEGYTSIH